MGRGRQRVNDESFVVAFLPPVLLSLIVCPNSLRILGIEAMPAHDDLPNKRTVSPAHSRPDHFAWY